MADFLIRGSWVGGFSQVPPSFTAATYAALMSGISAGQYQAPCFIFVLADETQGGIKNLYFYDGVTAVLVVASPAKGSNAWLQLYAALPDPLIVGAITRDGNGAITTAAVVWPDGTAGAFTTLVASTAFPGAVDSYSLTYGSPATKTATQPTVTRDSTSGAATVRPAIIIT